jgi:glutathione synthase/RimK-type ligase-like ATP-grasp enzyme
VVSDEGSPTVESVIECIASLGGEAHVLSTRRLPDDGCLSLGLNCAEVRASDGWVRLGDCKGIWHWHAETPQTDDTDASTARYVRREWELAIRGLAALSSERIWINHPSKASWLEGNKLAQMKLAREAGFDVPPTLLSNNPDEIARFAGSFDHVAVKSQGGAWRRLPGGEMSVAYTQRCTGDELDASQLALRRAPVMVQPYLDKAYELRVTVVDEKVFVCRIDSQASKRTKVDWRHDVEAVPHHLLDPSPVETNQFRAFLHAAGLRYAAIDLACTPDGKTYFLDLNPEGQFGWIEALTGAPITSALAEGLLSRSSSSGKLPQRT